MATPRKLTVTDAHLAEALAGRSLDELAELNSRRARV